MTPPARRYYLITGLILTYSLIIMIWNVMHDPLTPAEVRNIYEGRSVVETVAASGGPGSSQSGPVQARLGSAVTAPAVMAAAESLGGVYGARLPGVVLACLLIVTVSLIGGSPSQRGLGLLAALIFVFLGFPLQIASSVSPDIYAAVFLATALWCIEGPEKSEAVSAGAARLLLGAFCLSLATMTNYIVLLFALPLLLYALVRRWRVTTVLYLILPFGVLMALYGFFAILPVWPEIRWTLGSFRQADAARRLPFDYVFDWLAMPYLLATFGIFHEGEGKKAFFMMLLAAPALAVHMLTRDLETVHAAVFFSMIFLSRAAALGVIQMANIFSLHNTMKAIRPFFIAAVLVVVWVFGLQQIKALKRELPDLSPAVGFINQHGFAGMTVMVDSDYGTPEYVYRYCLKALNPPAKVLPLTRVSGDERTTVLMNVRPDFVVVDDHHSDRSFSDVCRECYARGYSLAKTIRTSLAAGEMTINIFKKGAS